MLFHFKIMKKKSILILAFFFLIIIPSYSEEALVIVNSENDLNELNTSSLKKIILKKKKRWSNGKKINVFLPERNSHSYYQVIERLLGIKKLKWDEYWERERFKGNFPPNSIKDDIKIIRIISKDLSSIGIINSKSFKGNIAKKLKVIYRIDHSEK